MLLLIQSFDFDPLKGTFSDIFNILNDLVSILLVCCKYGIVIMVFILGTLTLFRIKENKDPHTNEPNELTEEDNSFWLKINKPSLISSIIYLTIGIGLTFKFLTYALIYALEPIPDGFLFALINSDSYSSISAILNNFGTNPGNILTNTITLVSFISIIKILFSI
jgi:hypothetical protein